LSFPPATRPELLSCWRVAIAGRCLTFELWPLNFQSIFNVLIL